MSFLTRALILGSALVVAGCTINLDHATGVVGTGSPTSESRQVGPFTAVSAQSGLRVDLLKGSPAAVVVKAQPNLLGIISTTVGDDELTIHATQSYSTTDRVVVTVTTPEITGVSALGGVEVSGSGLDSTTLGLKAEGGSILRLSGRAARLDARANGGALLELGSVEVGDATIDFSAGVKATLNVSGNLRGTATAGVVVDLAVSPASVQVDTSAGAVVNYP